MHTPNRILSLSVLIALAVAATPAQAWKHHKKEAPPEAPSAPAVALPPPPPPPPVPVSFMNPIGAAQTAPMDLLLSASSEIQNVARWVNESRDNAGLPFLLVDKTNAQVYAFNSLGQLQATAPALLGMSKGDHLLAPNSASMSQMPPSVRITPAGRYISQLAIDSHNKELLVIDYNASISMHPVVKGTPQEHRAERLASATSDDNRISFGCINVPPAFYASFVHADFANTKGVVYILPEKSTAGELFGFVPAGPATPATQAISTVSGAATPGTTASSAAMPSTTTLNLSAPSTSTLNLSAPSTTTLNLSTPSTTASSAGTSGAAAVQAVKTPGTN
jgi:hypothetical protein